MKTKHVNIIDDSERIYCYKHDALVKMNSDYIESTCGKCPYLHDVDAMEGSVTCLFDDACNEDRVEFDDAGDSEYHSKMQAYRLGLDTKNNIIDSLKCMNDFSAERTPEDDDGSEDADWEEVVNGS